MDSGSSEGPLSGDGYRQRWVAGSCRREDEFVGGEGRKEAPTLQRIHNDSTATLQRLGDFDNSNDKVPPTTRREKTKTN